jgi:H+/gluconate symporter-like permease
MWFFARRTAGNRWPLIGLAVAMAALQAFNWLEPQPMAIIDPAPVSAGILGLIAYAILAALALWVAQTREMRG